MCIRDSYDVEFNYTDALQSAEDEKTAIEKFASQGCQAIISFSSNDRVQQIETCEKYGVYYAVASGAVSYTHLDVYKRQIETYENKAAKMESGAIDHVAIDVKDIEKVYELINQADLNTTRDIIHFLPFWENGVRFFTIEGPNKEKIEFSQYL